MTMNHFKGKQFQQDVIIVSVGYYLRYNLSYREVQEILYDRGINVSHTTIYRWVQEYGKLLYQIWKKKNKKSFYSWKMDETYIKIKGKWHYLYRAIDAEDRKSTRLNSSHQKISYAVFCLKKKKE